MYAELTSLLLIETTINSIKIAIKQHTRKIMFYIRQENILYPAAIQSFHLIVLSLSIMRIIIIIIDSKLNDVYNNGFFML